MHRLRGAYVVVVFFFFLNMSLWQTTRARRDEGTVVQRQLPREELVSMAGYGEEKLSSVLIMGDVVCESCHKPGSQLHTSHVAGAKISVTCRTHGKTRRTYTNRANATTDEYGEFIIDLPSHLHAIPKLEEACVVRALRLPKKSPCHRVFHTNPRKIKLSSVGNGIRVYTAETFRVRRREDGREKLLG